MKRLKKGTIYLVKFLDHNESEGDPNPEGTLYIVGKYLGMKGKYFIFANWWSDDLDEEGVMTRANVLRKAVIEIKELK